MQRSWLRGSALGFGCPAQCVTVAPCATAFTISSLVGRAESACPLPVVTVGPVDTAPVETAGGTATVAAAGTVVAARARVAFGPAFAAGKLPPHADRANTARPTTTGSHFGVFLTTSDLREWPRHSLLRTRYCV